MGALAAGRKPWAVWLGWPALAAYAWWATSLRPFTDPALAVTLATGLVVILAGRRAGRPPGAVLSPPDRDRAGLAGWALLFLALAAWELAAFLQLPRSEHPTLSSLANSVFDSHLVRAAAFSLWILAGFGIARR